MYSSHVYFARSWLSFHCNSIYCMSKLIELNSGKCWRNFCLAIYNLRIKDKQEINMSDNRSQYAMSTSRIRYKCKIRRKLLVEPALNKQWCVTIYEFTLAFMYGILEENFGNWTLVVNWRNTLPRTWFYFP